MCESSDNSVAVYAKDLCFAYFKCDPILKGIDLSVNKANICGLLGPSGCGKTTLLKCILGRLKLKRGDIQIFGTKRGSPQCHIPGPGVGYMPQESGLYMEFTIEEILNYFGKIYSMNRIDIKEKTKELINVLNLIENKLIGQLSGGQQRRVSLACALIHSPPLLILDEPTVGTDPLLRQKIWFHLQSLCNSGQTIILTTHYIEEVRTANVVAFMRNGRILANDEPILLLNKYQTHYLEEVFLKLCHSEDNQSLDKNNKTFDIEIQNFCYENEVMVDVNNEEKRTTSEFISNNTESQTVNLNEKYLASITDNTLDIKSNVMKIDYKNSFQTKSALIGKYSALLNKNFKRLTRNWTLLIFFILMPALTFAITLYSIGVKPTNLYLSVFDEEVFNNITNDWGQLFTKAIDNKTFTLIDCQSLEEAMDSVKSGESHAFIHINERFSKSLRLRHFYGSDADEEVLEDSKILVHIDWSDQVIGLQIERYLYEAMAKFAREVALLTDTDPNSISIPLKFEEPVYGKRSESLRDFMLPGSLVINTFFAACFSAANMIIEEQSTGITERSLVAGITAEIFLFSNVLTQFMIICLQTLFILIIALLMFSQQVVSVFAPVAALMVSQGMCGFGYGIMVAVLCRDLFYATNVSVFMFMVSIVMGGIFWPIENMPKLVQYVSPLMPHSLPIRSMRYILYREWSLTYFEVYMGFVVTYLWFAFFLIISLIFLRKYY